MNSKLITLIIPIYNIYEFLEEAIKSINSQDYDNIEIIVVDDGSNLDAKNNIIRICEKHDSVTLVHQKNKGQAKARETGVKMSKGEYIMFLDADDVLMEGAVTHLISALESDHKFIASYGQKIVIDEFGNRLSPDPLPTIDQANSGDILTDILKGKPLLSNGNICIKKEYIEKVDFPERIRQGEDWITWCRLALLGEFKFIGEKVVLFIREHRSSVSQRTYSNPLLTFKMLDLVYEDADFIKKLGIDKLKKCKLIHRNHIKAHFVYSYRKRKQYFGLFIFKLYKRLWFL